MRFFEGRACVRACVRAFPLHFVPVFVLCRSLFGGGSREVRLEPCLAVIFRGDGDLLLRDSWKEIRKER